MHTTVLCRTQIQTTQVNKPMFEIMQAPLAQTAAVRFTA